MIKNGEYYDTGDKLGYVKTIIDFSLQHPELRRDVLKFIRKKVV
jgi:UTP--glucose-1-phosphate uridylyltransferase